MTTKNAIETIVKLVVSARLERGLAQQPFAKLAGVSYGTLRSFESGERIPRDTSQRKIEDALGWRSGVIQEVIDGADTIPPESLTLDYMREGAEESSWEELDAEEARFSAPVSRAGQLSNEELIGELALRLYNKRIDPKALKAND